MKKTTLLLLGLCIASPTIHAAENNEPGFWDMLRMKIEQMTPQKKLSATTAVGGVRGAPVEDSDVYWKGEAKPITIDPDELAAFQNAVTLADAGKKPEAQAAFAAFARNYPDSTLRKDAEQAVSMLQQK
jgi:TolA-binding protein